MWSRHILSPTVHFYNMWGCTVYTAQRVCEVRVGKWRVLCSFQVPLISVASFFFVKNESFSVHFTKNMLNLIYFPNLLHVLTQLCESGTKTFNRRMRTSLASCWWKDNSVNSYISINILAMILSFIVFRLPMLYISKARGTICTYCICSCASV